ncbi:cytochrome c biogenesis CcdA family protein [Halopenitus sp. H-Gu1]|uniref:cytochrome c biogenesis CcdA family protein n=1 Tax=Halopenitus sp. H-Gu1 TaxID=3242697 RepID=UPI00359E3AA5
MVFGATGTAAFAVGAGAATFFAPCAYALLPGYVGYYAATIGESRPPLFGVVVRGLAAAIGSLGSFLVLSLVAVVAGDLLERALPSIELLTGVLVALLGVAVLTDRTGSLHVSLPERRSSILGFLGFGAVYALAATACVLPLFLAVAVRSLTFGPAGTVVVLGAYGGSFGMLVLVVTVATGVGYDLFAERVAAHAETVRRVAGIVLMLAGLAQAAIALPL